jgi:saccharopine dehydrogenase (NAD+, L-lysine-forming)
VGDERNLTVLRICLTNRHLLVNIMNLFEGAEAVLSRRPLLDGDNMRYKIGIRREDKNKWERRSPLVPADVEELIQNHPIDVYVQPSPIRIFPDHKYTEAGATIQEDLSGCPVVFAVKEIPQHLFSPKSTYVFFSHTIKGQKKNMPMLKRMMELECNLIEYEKVVDEKGGRLLFFGRHAGLAGMIDTLWALGQRLSWEDIPNPFVEIKNAYRYATLAEAKESISLACKKIKDDGLPRGLTPLVFGVTGYGHVSSGAQEILDLLPHKQINPEELFSLDGESEFSKRHIYKVVFKEEHLVEPVSAKHQFELQAYYHHPHKYRSQFERYLPHINVLVNCIYWDERYPRLVTKKSLKKLFTEQKNPRLRIVGDISCDIEGSIEFTVKATQPDNPAYVYDPVTEKITDGYQGRGVVNLPVDNFPCELSRRASIDFSHALKPLVPTMAMADYSVGFKELALPEAITNAVILYQGKLTHDYRYIQDFL